MKLPVSNSWRTWIKVLLILYLVSLSLFVFFPRPILESGDPTAIAEFIKSHSGIFYRILYADAQSVATANFFMLTPFVLLAALVRPKVKLSQIALRGIGISVIIEAFQTVIPGRVSDLTDLMSNSVSVLLGIVFVAILRKTSIFQ
ncbi:MAG: VanZ family protein [Flavobacteriales bacterium]